MIKTPKQQSQFQISILQGSTNGTRWYYNKREKVMSFNVQSMIISCAIAWIIDNWLNNEIKKKRECFWRIINLIALSNRSDFSNVFENFLTFTDKGWIKFLQRVNIKQQSFFFALKSYVVQHSSSSGYSIKKNIYCKWENVFLPVLKPIT